MFDDPNLKFLYRIVRANFKTPFFPPKVGFITTYRCNLKCQMCKIWEKQPGNELSCDEIENFFSISNKFSWVGVTGGEPFLRKDLAQISEIILHNCKDLCVIQFATNGTLTETILETTERIIASKNSKVKVLFSISIDGVREAHDKIRGVPGSWDRTVQTYLRLKSFPGVEPRINITLTNDNADTFEDIFLSIKDKFPPLKIDDIGINIFQKSPFYYANQKLPDLEESLIIKTIDKILQFRGSHFSYNNFIRRAYLKSYKYFIHNKRPSFNCQALSFNCLIDPAGDIYPCNVINKKISNIRDFNYDLSDFWRRPIVNELRIKCFQNDCPSCWSPCEAYSAIICGLLKNIPQAIRLL